MKRENYLYIGMDLHKKEHTAVLVDCWNERLDTIVIENKPSEFDRLARRVSRKANKMGLTPIYGLENAYGHGRSLAVWLIERGHVVKDVNPALSYEQRKSAPMVQKYDEWDAHCVATVLINHLHELPDAKPEDAHWTLAQLVSRRDHIVKDGIRLKNGLHERISNAYPSYHKFFCHIDTKTALYFWKKYPSPIHLQTISADELSRELRSVVAVTKKDKGELILECVHKDGAHTAITRNHGTSLPGALHAAWNNKKRNFPLLSQKLKVC